jgi:N-[(2S)-2-amino-2-carboxyethyl]-L-glutamate dehydrogenase
MSPPPLRVLGSDATLAVIEGDLPGCISVVRDAYLAHHDGHAINPNSCFLRFPDRPNARIIALPASLGAGFEVSGIKWIASYPDNLKLGIPRASAVVILNDLETGYPFACLEGATISAARTAASAALAARNLVGSDRVPTLGVVGAGLIARYVVRFLAAAGLRFDEARVHDLDPREAERFRDQVCATAAAIGRSRTASLAEALQSELVVFATTASEPYVTAPFSSGQVVLHLSLRDLDPEVVLAADNVVDDVDHVMNAGTSLHLAEQRTGRRDFVTATLAQLVRGERAVDAARPVVFSPFGMGILDLAVARWIHDRAVESELGTAFPDFFSLTR